MMKKRSGTLSIVIAVAVMLLVGMTLIGCGAKSQEDSPGNALSQDTESAPTVYKIGFNSPLATLQFMNDLETGMAAAAEMMREKAGIEVQFFSADAKGSVENTISNIETFIAQKVDMIITVNTNPPATAQLIEEAHEAGIQFCVVGMTVGTEDLHAGVPDYQGSYDVAYELGNWIKDNLNSEGKDGKVLLIQNQTTETMQTRTQGSIDGLNASGCRWEIVQRIDVTKGTADEALPLVTDAITANPSINVFVTSNDNTAMACLEASRQAGMKPEDYVIAGFGLETPSIPTFLTEGTPYRFSYSLPSIYAGNVIMHACIASLEEIIFKNGDGTPYDILLPGFVSDASTIERFYNRQADGTWSENLAEMEQLFLQDERYVRFLSLGK